MPRVYAPATMRKAQACPRAGAARRLSWWFKREKGAASEKRLHWSWKQQACFTTFTRKRAHPGCEGGDVSSDALPDSLHQPMIKDPKKKTVSSSIMWQYCAVPEELWSKITLSYSYTKAWSNYFILLLKISRESCCWHLVSICGL